MFDSSVRLPDGTPMTVTHQIRTPLRDREVRPPQPPEVPNRSWAETTSCHILPPNRGFHKWATPKCMIYKGTCHLEMDDLGIPLFQETSKSPWLLSWGQTWVDQLKRGFSLHPVLKPLVLSPQIGEYVRIRMYVSTSGKISLVFQWLHRCPTMHSHSWTANVAHATDTMACCKGNSRFIYISKDMQRLFKGLNQKPSEVTMDYHNIPQYHSCFHWILCVHKNMMPENRICSFQPAPLHEVKYPWGDPATCILSKLIAHPEEAAREAGAAGAAGACEWPHPRWRAVERWVWLQNGCHRLVSINKWVIFKKCIQFKFLLRIGVCSPLFVCVCVCFKNGRPRSPLLTEQIDGMSWDPRSSEVSIGQVLAQCPSPIPTVSGVHLEWEPWWCHWYSSVTSRGKQKSQVQWEHHHEYLTSRVFHVLHCHVRLP